jgi:hypothetical protein
VLQEYYDHWFNVTESVLEVTGVLGSIAFQPVPRTFSQKAKDRGGVRCTIPNNQVLATNKTPGPSRRSLGPALHLHRARLLLRSIHRRWKDRRSQHRTLPGNGQPGPEEH